MTGPRIDVDCIVLHIDTLQSSSILGALDNRDGNQVIIENVVDFVYMLFRKVSIASFFSSPPPCANAGRFMTLLALKTFQRHVSVNHLAARDRHGDKDRGVLVGLGLGL